MTSAIVPRATTMTGRCTTFGILTLVLGGFLGPKLLSAQGPPLSVEDLPLAQYGGAENGQTVTPVYEGWYENPDGTLTLSFGYYNRNTVEVVHVPVGSRNRVEGVSEEFDQGQPAYFEPGRHWGVFGVRVPPSFGDGEVVWAVNVRGETFQVPGHLREDWVIPAIAGDAMGNSPPTVRLEGGATEAFGPGGARLGSLSARAGRPMTLAVWAADDGVLSSDRPGRPDPVALTWFLHRGPDDVTIRPRTDTVPNSGGRFEATATFSTAGQYVLRVRVNDDSGLAPAGHEQCCWTNGFLNIRVLP